MKPLSDRDLARLDELLADSALGPVTPAEAEELERLLERAGGEPDPSFDRAAAAVDLALAGGRYEALPASLERAIERDARRYFEQARPTPRTRLRRTTEWVAWATAAGMALWIAVEARRGDDGVEGERTARLAAERDEAEGRLAEARRERELERRMAAEVERSLRAEIERLGRELGREREALARRAAEDLARREGELLAERASLLADQARAFGEREEELLGEIEALRGMLRELDPAGLRQRLVGEAPDLVRLDWSATEDPLVVRAGVRGDVVWSPSRQEGYMTFRNLPPNRPQERQYQLWIFDGTRDEAMPVDGGVFDIPDGADQAVVPIRARLPVRELTAFAVTLEPAGGVVVSRREHLVLVAGL